MFYIYSISYVASSFARLERADSEIIRSCLLFLLLSSPEAVMVKASYLGLNSSTVNFRSQWTA